MEVKSIGRYLLRVQARHQNKIVGQIKSDNVDCYILQIKTLRQWHDRKKYIDTPLFGEYVVINLRISSEPLKYQSLRGVFYFITGIRPVLISNAMIKHIKIMINNSEKARVSNDSFQTEDIVQIQCGPLSEDYLNVRAENH